MKWISFFVIGVFLAFGSFYTLWGSWDKSEHIATQWVSDFYAVKKDISQAVPGNKVLIVSGSNAMFAFDSERLSNRLNKPVVNYGVAIGLGLRYILETAKTQLNKGDVALLPLEFNLYADKIVPDKTLSLHLLSNRGYFETLSLYERLNVVLFTPTHSLYEQPQQGDFHKDLYNADKLNEFGDLKSKELSRIYVQHNVNKYSFPNVSIPKMNDRSVELLTDFVTWAKLHEIKVVAMPPASLQSIGDHNAQKAKQSVYTFWESIGVPFIGKFSMFQFHKENMFENPYHLNVKGRDMFMDRLLGDSLALDVAELL